MNFATSVHALTEWGQPVKSFRQVLAEAAEVGYSGIMLMHVPGQHALTAENPDPPGAMIDLAQSDLGFVRKVVEEAGLTVGCVYQALMKVGDEAEMAGTIDGLTDLAKWGEVLGTNIVLPNAGAAPQPQMPAADKRELIGRVAAVLTEAVDASPAGTRIAPDIHYGGILETVADCEELFRLTSEPRVGIALNIGHMTTLHQEGWRLIDDHADRVPVIAWKDHLLQPPAGHTHPIYSVELGTGDSPFAEYARRLPADGGPHLHLITFEHVPLEQKKDSLGRSLQYLQKLWAQTH